jgi:hypothetical protein
MAGASNVVVNMWLQLQFLEYLMQHCFVLTFEYLHFVLPVV